MKFATRISSIRRQAWKQCRSCSADSDSMCPDSLARWTLAGWIRSPSGLEHASSPGPAPASRSRGSKAGNRSRAQLARDRDVALLAWPSADRGDESARTRATDLYDFEALLAAGKVDEALALSRGPLLDGLDDDWVHALRDEHRERVASALAGLAADAEADGDLGAATALTRRIVALDPLAEEPQRELIRRLAAAGDRPAALAAYRRLQDRLRSELAIAPSARTRELVASLREDPGPAPTAPSPDHPTGTVTLLFTDQVSSTETLLRLGDDAAERLRRSHFALLREVAGTHGGQEVKNLGDGLMVAFASAVDAVACAIAIEQAVSRRSEEGVAVRVGLNVGEPIVDEGDYFGTAVVVAKRLCDAAGAGQILASDVVRALVGTRGGFAFRRVGAVPLKGIAEPVEACEVDWEPTTEQRIPLPPAVLGTETGAFVGRAKALEELRATGPAWWRASGASSCSPASREWARRAWPPSSAAPHTKGARPCWPVAATRRCWSRTGRSSRRCATTSRDARPRSWRCRSRPGGASSRP
jgi:class 3 adenylate cyclase